MDVCLRVLESNNRRFDSYSVRNSLLIIPFGIVGCIFFSTTFLKIAVYCFVRMRLLECDANSKMKL